MKKLNACSTGGYSRLQTALLEEKEIQCHACQELMKSCGFRSEELKKQVDGHMMGFQKVKQESQAKTELDSEDENIGLDKLVEEPNQKKMRGANEEHLVHAYVKTLAPVIRLLEPGTHGKRVPYQCCLCKSKHFPHGKVGEASAMKLNVVEHFIGAHLRSGAHYKNKLKAESLEEVPGAMVPCMGVSIDDPDTGGSLFTYREEFALRGAVANFSEHARHTYTKDGNSGAWIVHSYECAEEVEQMRGRADGRHCCSKCRELGGRRSIVRSCIRFAVKYYAAKWLACRLFHGEKAQVELNSKIMNTALYRGNKKQMDSLLNTDIARLQSFVRSSFMCDAFSTPALCEFKDIVVKPCLDIHVASVPKHLSDLSAKFAAMLATGNFADDVMVSLKIAASAISGNLSGHPLIQGLALQTHRMMEKESRGIGTMVGRRANESSLEKSLIANAGLQLAVAAGNSKLARHFGLSSSSHRVNLEILKQRGLPTPALAVCFPEHLRQNFVLLDQAYPRTHSSPKRDLDAHLFTKWEMKAY